MEARDPRCVRLLAVSDLHLSCHSPSAWTGSYEAVTFDALRQLWEFARRVEVDAVLCAGDVFHLKGEGRNPVSFVTRVVRLLREAPCPVLGIAGNHDLTRGSIAAGLGAPMEALVEAGAYRLLDGKPEFIDGIGEGLSVVVRGASFDHGSPNGFLNLASYPSPDRVVRHVSLGHFNYCRDGGGEFYGERSYGPEDLESGVWDVAVIGHHHHDQGVLDLHSGGGRRKLVAVGSTGWTGVHEADRERRPAACLLEIGCLNTRATKVHPRLPQFEEVVDVRVHEQATQERKELDEFVTQLAEAEFAPEDPLRALEGMDLPAEVRSRALDYLRGAS